MQIRHHRSIQRSLALTLALMMTCVTTTGCEELEELAQEITDELADEYQTGPRKLSGDDAFKHISPDRSTSPRTDTLAIQSAITQEIHHEMSGVMMMDKNFIKLILIDLKISGIMVTL